ncbi:hypothetical protein DPMN_169035 [Dreissena polymorpha]|uniref:Uncharacterized protein n=1 Tax=Dreissena polymorpha TaxID=45954 RepID=A0A9D4F303_DREPO|nr:hypothetical protein DPMN_169035 [Dreissena polymorpha]
MCHEGDGDPRRRQLTQTSKSSLCCQPPPKSPGFPANLEIRENLEKDSFYPLTQGKVREFGKSS